MIISSAFLMDFVLSVAFSLDRWAYLWSVNGLVDFLSVLPMLPFIAYHVPGSKMDSRAESGFHWIESTNLCRHVLPHCSMSIHLLSGCIMPVFDRGILMGRRSPLGDFPESEATVPCVCMWQGAACCQGVSGDASVDGQFHERQAAPHTGSGGR